MRLSSKFFFTTLYLLRMDKDCPEYSLPEGYTIHKLAEDDIDTVAAAHRSREVVEERLKSGDIAYWIRHKDICINIQWYSVKDYYVWDLRAVVSFAQGSSYLYDGFTDPAYRGKGLNKAALSSLIFDAGLLSHGSIFSITQKSNPMGWGFLEKFGFHRAAEVSLLQIPPVRIYTVNHDNKTECHLRLMGLHTRPIHLDLDSIQVVG